MPPIPPSFNPLLLLQNPLLLCNVFPCGRLQYLHSSVTSSPPPNHAPWQGRPHLRTLMVWPDETILPTSNDLIKDGDLHQAQQQIALMANAIAQYEPVWLYSKESTLDEATKSVSHNVTVKLLDADNLWMRETSPLYMSTSESTSLCDVDTTPKCLEKSDRVSPSQAPSSIHGTPIETDGDGTLLITENSLHHIPTDKYKAHVEAELRAFLDAKKIIWLHGTKRSDITNLARFAPNDTVVLSRPNDALSRRHVKWGAYRQAKFTLSATTSAAGRKLDVVEIEEAMTNAAPGSEARASYTNFYFINGAVIVPQFGDEKTDGPALATMKRLFPERDVVPVMLDSMVYFSVDGGPLATLQAPPPSVEL